MDEPATTFSTPYGPIPYTLSDDGKTAFSPVLDLPEAALKLSYGNRWGKVREYVRALVKHLPHRLAVEARFGPDWQRVKWQERRENAALFEPFLRTLIPLVGQHASVEETQEVYWAMGKLGTDTARDYLLGQLERKGRHLYTNIILQALRGYVDADTQDRLLALYPKFSNSQDYLKTYFLLLQQFRGERVVALARRAVEEHPGKAGFALNILRANGYGDDELAEVLAGALEREYDFFGYDLLLSELNRLRPTEPVVSLTEVNAWMERAELLDVGPVNWPQDLPTGWAGVLEGAPLNEIVAVVQRYLARSESRLQHNALLQLKYFVGKDSRAEKFPIGAVEDRLSELLTARYDKISTSALAVVTQQFHRLSAPKRMIDRLFNIALRSRYKLMVSAALRRGARDNDLAEHMLLALGRMVEKAKTETERAAVRKFLPYVRFLNHLGAYAGAVAPLGRGKSN